MDILGALDNKRFIERNAFSLDHVEKSIIDTPEGKERYYNFLTNSPEISGYHKLFGIKVSREDISDDDIKKQIKMLSFHLHPDKNEGNPMCTRLFQLVKNAEKSIKEPITISSSFLDPFNPYKSIDSQLKEEMEEGNWKHAEELVRGGSAQGILKDSSAFPVLVSICLFRIGKTEEAIDALPDSFVKIKEVFLEYKAHINGSKEDLLGLLAQLNGLQESAKDYDFPEAKMFSHVIPHYLYVQLSACFEKHDIEYEQYLRLSIRSCPDNLGEEKRNLIKKLEECLDTIYDASLLKPISVESEISAHSIQVCDEFSKNPDLPTNIKNYLKQFQNSMKCDLLKSAIDAAGKKPNQMLSFFSSHSNQTKQVLSELSSKLLGFYCYLSGDKIKAAHYFSKYKQLFFLGLVQIELYEYDRGISSWQEYYKARIANKEKKGLEDFIFNAMNMCDMLYVSEESSFRRRLRKVGELDDFQVSVLRKIRARKEVGLSISNPISASPGV